MLLCNHSKIHSFHILIQGSIHWALLLPFITHTPHRVQCIGAHLAFSPFVFRFSDFVKSGTEAYVLGASASVVKKGAPILESEKIRIVVRGREREGMMPLEEESAFIVNVLVL